MLRFACVYQCGRKTSVFSPFDFMEKRTSDTNSCINVNHMIVEFPLHQLMGPSVLRLSILVWSSMLQLSR